MSSSSAPTDRMLVAMPEASDDDEPPTLRMIQTLPDEDAEEELETTAQHYLPHPL